MILCDKPTIYPSAAMKKIIVNVNYSPEERAGPPRVGPNKNKNQLFSVKVVINLQFLRLAIA